MTGGASSNSAVEATPKPLKSQRRKGKAWEDRSFVPLPNEPEDEDVTDFIDEVRSMVAHEQQDNAEAKDDLPTPLTRSEILEEQRTDDFCQTILATQVSEDKTWFFEDEDGVLCRRDPRQEEQIQVVLPLSLRARVLRLAHHSPLAGHPGQTRLHKRVRRSYYWPQMAADVAATVRNCVSCAKNRLRLSKQANPMQLFPAETPLESVAIDILGPLPKSKRKYEFILVIADRFTKLTQIVPLRKITALDVAKAFAEHWVFKYGAPVTLLSDNESQFVARFFQQVCRILQVNNIFTTAYHPQTNGQVERFNRSLCSMLRCYVDDHPTDWCVYAPALCYAYNMSVHRSTNTTPFDLVLSRAPADFTMAYPPSKVKKNGKESRGEFVERLEVTLHKARDALARTQARYKLDFDKRVKPSRPYVRGDWIFLDTNDGVKKRPKLTHDIAGPFEVLDGFGSTVIIKRGDVVENVSANRLTHAPYHSAPDRRSEDPTPTDLAAKTTSGTTWVFKRILDHRENNRGTLDFKIEWDGDYRPTWEPREKIPEEAISRYFARLRRA